MTFEHRCDGNEEAGLRKYFAGRENSKLQSLELGVHMVCKRNSKKARTFLKFQEISGLPEHNRLRGEQQEAKSAGQPWSHRGCEDYLSEYESA